MNFLRVIRYQNLLMLVLMQLILRYGFLKLIKLPGGIPVPLALKDFHYALLILSTVCIAAGGYLINDIFDQETDRENKPGKVVIGKTISEKTGYRYYAILNIIGVGVGTYLSLLIGRMGFSMLFISIVIVLYLYASSLKQSLLIGNLIVAVLLSVSVLIVGIFDLYPMLTFENRGYLGTYFIIMLAYAAFAFLINFIRELVKDLEDVDGDYNEGMNTLPIVLGVDRTAILVFWLSLVPILILLYCINEYLVKYDLFFSVGYALALIVAPLIYFSAKMWSARKQQEFHHLANVLKLVLFFGILSITVMTINIVQLHA